MTHFGKRQDGWCRREGPRRQTTRAASVPTGWQALPWVQVPSLDLFHLQSDTCNNSSCTGKQ